MPAPKTIRTRLGSERVFERLGEFVRDRAPRANTVFSDGYVCGGVMDAPHFRLIYWFQPRSRSVLSGQYSVRGVVEDTAEWRLLHLSTASNRSATGILASVGLIVAGLSTAALYVGELPPRYLAVSAAVAGFFLLLAVVARFGIPRLVLRRVARIVAGEADGSVLSGGRWKVLRGPGWW